MPTFKIRMHGTHTDWPSDWNVNRDITLLKCKFSRTSLEQTRNLSIETHVDAPKEEEAVRLGRERISKELDLFALCVENWLQLDEDHIWADEV